MGEQSGKNKLAVKDLEPRAAGEVKGGFGAVEHGATTTAKPQVYLTVSLKDLLVSGVSG